MSVKAAGWRLMAVLLMAGCWAGCDAGGAGATASSGREGNEAGAQSGSGRAGEPTRRVRLVWPTPDAVFLQGGGPELFVQPTVSGRIESGLFGSVRSGGRQFHEGLDIAPSQRDRAGEALDPILAALAGVVRHVNARAGASGYGRYVVMEHPEESPPVYTLYAHLAEVAPGVAPGRMLAAGERLGTMGRSASGKPIPKERAHLHFEIGVRVTDHFESWYRAQKFGSPNEQGLWNGMNLMGIDPLVVFARHRAGGMRALDEVFAELPVAATLWIASAQEPDFVRRYPSLVAAAPAGAGPRKGWEIRLGVSGVPLRWRALDGRETAGWREGEVRIISADTELLRANRGRKIVRETSAGPMPDEDAKELLDQLF